MTHLNFGIKLERFIIRKETSNVNKTRQLRPLNEGKKLPRDIF
jgi:hypothetical protein